MKEDEGLIYELHGKIIRLEERTMAYDAALHLAREQLERWQAGSNEWRQALNDQRSQFITTDRANALFLAIEARLILLEKSKEGRDSSDKKGESIFTKLMVISALILSILALSIKFIN